MKSVTSEASSSELSSIVIEAVANSESIQDVFAISAPGNPAVESALITSSI